MSPRIHKPGRHIYVTKRRSWLETAGSIIIYPNKKVPPNIIYRIKCSLYIFLECVHRAVRIKSANITMERSDSDPTYMRKRFEVLSEYDQARKKASNVV